MSCYLVLRDAHRRGPDDDHRHQREIRGRGSARDLGWVQFHTFHRALEGRARGNAHDLGSVRLHTCHRVSTGLDRDRTHVGVRQTADRDPCLARVGNHDAGLARAGNRDPRLALVCSLDQFDGQLLLDAHHREQAPAKTRGCARARTRDCNYQTNGPFVARRVSVVNVH